MNEDRRAEGCSTGRAPTAGSQHWSFDIARDAVKRGEVSCTATAVVAAAASV